MRKQLLFVLIPAALFGSSVMVGAEAVGERVQSSDPIAVALGTDVPETKQRIIEAQLARQRRFEQEVASCAARAGVPPDGLSALRAHTYATPPTIVLSEEEELRTYGYGVTNGPFLPEERGAARLADPGFPEPNVAPQDVSALRTCERRAWEAVFSRLVALSDAYDDAETAMYEALANDPQVKAARARWRRCMGGRFDSPPEVADYLRPDFEGLRGSGDPARGADQPK